MVLGSIVYGYATLRADVTRLTQDVAALKKPESRKPDLCETLMASLNIGLLKGDKALIDATNAQLEKFDCYSLTSTIPNQTPEELKELLNSTSEAETYTMIGEKDEKKDDEQKEAE